MSIRENIEKVNEEIAAACARSGRDESEVRLMAVSKYVETERILEAVEAGQRLFGENHAQELKEKKTFFEQHGCDVHFIGHLQTNKIKYVCGFAGMIESVDRENLAQLLQQRAMARATLQDILIQVNIGEEEQKGGITDVDLDYFAEMLAGMPNLRVRGLMCVPPDLEAEKTRLYFRRMRTLFDGMRDKRAFGAFDTLSMGMTHDFAVAVEEGATEVRVGTGIFGARDRK